MSLLWAQGSVESCSESLTIELQRPTKGLFLCKLDILIMPLTTWSNRSGCYQRKPSAGLCNLSLNQAWVNNTTTQVLTYFEPFQSKPILAQGLFHLNALPSLSCFSEVATWRELPTTRSANTWSGSWRRRRSRQSSCWTRERRKSASGGSTCCSLESRCSRCLMSCLIMRFYNKAIVFKCVEPGLGKSSIFWANDHQEGLFKLLPDMKVLLASALTHEFSLK